MHSKGDKLGGMISDEADEVIKKLFDSLKSRYQNNVQLMKGNEFVFNYVSFHWSAKKFFFLCWFPNEVILVK